MDTSIVQKLNDFFSSYPLSSYKKGDVLIDAYQTPPGIFYIEEGIVRRFWIFENGSEITLNLYKPHSFLPMSWAIGNIANTHIYEALTDMKVRMAPKSDVLAFLKKEPEVLYDLLKRVYTGVEGLWSHIQSLTAGNSYTKLIASLIILAKRFGKMEEGTLVVQLKLGEQEIANYAGMSRETMSRELQKLKKKNMVSYGKGILTVKNIDLLQKEVLL